MYEFSIRTERQNFYNVTANVERAVKDSGITDGMCMVYCPHTTAGMTINENADPDVVSDILFALDKTFPDREEFRHAEGNTTAHLKASTMGSSVTIIVENGKLMLGTWQGVYFCEFDGPRIRHYYVKVIAG
jgi:secondary thiamine-phosphate synthase enzyme